MTEIDGAIALVTGASSGIGAATAKALARAGCIVAVVARRADRLAETVEQCGGASQAMAIAADLGLAGEPEQVVREVIERKGRLDILVNNAGISLHEPTQRTTPEALDHVMAVNFRAPVLAGMAALPDMLTRGRGSIVNVTSVAGTLPNPREAAYGASKAALARWTHGLAVDLTGTGVHAGVCSPGPIDTEIWNHDDSPETYQGKLYSPELVADAIVEQIRDETVHRTVPRQYGALAPMYQLPGVNRLLRWGLTRYGDATAGNGSAPASSSGETEATTW